MPSAGEFHNSIKPFLSVGCLLLLSKDKHWTLSVPSILIVAVKNRSKRRKKNIAENSWLPNPTKLSVTKFLIDFLNLNDALSRLKVEPKLANFSFGEFLFW